MAKKRDKQQDKTFTGTFWLLLILALLAGALITQRLIQPLFEKQGQMNPVGELYEMSVGESRLMVEVRDTPEGMEKGLSYRESLEEGKGMVFLYSQPQQPLFWMKDMHFSIDIVWIREGEVVDIDRKVPPPTEENPRVQTAVPDEPVDTVLEVPAGWVDEQGIEEGEVVDLDYSG